MLSSIQYNVAICQLFTPLLECPNFTLLAQQHIRAITKQSALDGLTAYRSYRNLFTNRYQPPFQAFSLVHLCDVLLRYGNKAESEEVIRLCLETLTEALPGFSCIGPLQAMFCESVLSTGYTLPPDVEKMMGGRRWQSFSREDKLDCCERLTYAQPVDLLAERLDSEISSNFEDEWKAFIENRGNEDAEDEQCRSGSGQDSDEHESSANGSRRNHSMNITAVMNDW
jgi:hypothetical protein